MSEPGNRRLKLVGLGAGVAAIAVVATGIVSRTHNDDRLTEVATARAIPSVTVIHPAAGQGEAALTLPAALQAFNTAPIYARTSGYVRQWLVNIGDNVRRGQVLAILDAPEVEQQLAAARADLRTAEANRQLASTSAERWTTMLAKDAVSKQETDERRGELAARIAQSAAARANVSRLTALTGFTRLRAPFDGVVTTRTTEIGALVTAGTAASQPLFTVADIHRIRAMVRVPQAYVAQVREGMTVQLALPEYPGRQFSATLTRRSRAVDPSSGTMLVEVQAPNGEGALNPGSYAQASFPVSGVSRAVSLPPSALMVGQNGTRVAVLRADGRAQLRPVTIARDLGKSVEISAGLSVQDRVIDSPPDSLQTGDQVRVLASSGSTARGAR
ncbi:efflux RND transporter periplasmic adaptor subunit [Sphingomonas phyllosphaerae]|uniref:efflux RND transporter periplasmic adaptor subunit n=1 Tax=Sphingomonas phyllosphaerae TaxID=257003 RepID=UPI00040ECD90|nr:efflux RND transporter periplasmic adaptor subunit [Sphingomonas phyllosphaerae]